jgi:hypothetical protein
MEPITGFLMRRRIGMIGKDFVARPDELRHRNFLREPGLVRPASLN